MLGKWWNGGAVPLEEVFVIGPPTSLKTLEGKATSDGTFGLGLSGGYSVTSWLELGVMGRLGVTPYNMNGPTFKRVTGINLMGGPVVRPYARYGSFRVWGSVAYVYSWSDGDFEYRDPTQVSTLPSVAETAFLPVFGGGADVAFGTKTAFMLTLGIEASTPPRLDTPGVVTGPVLPATRLHVGFGIAL